MKKIIFILLFFIISNYSFAKDLSGNALECEGSWFGNNKNQRGDPRYVAIQFFNEFEAKISFIKYENTNVEPLIYLKIENIKYKVTDEKIILQVGNLKKINNPKKKFIGSEWDIYREDLFMDTYIGGLDCKLVKSDDFKLQEMIKKNYIKNPFKENKEPKTNTKKLL